MTGMEAEGRERGGECKGGSPHASSRICAKVAAGKLHRSINDMYTELR